MSASSELRDLYVREYNDLGDKITRYHEISSNPRVGVGISKSGKHPFLLVLPLGSVDRQFISETIETTPIAQREIESIQVGTLESITASILSFRSLTKAAEIFVDSIVDAALESKDASAVAELVSEFIELFNKKTSLSAEEVVGFFGELLILEMSRQVDVMIENWHTNTSDRFDFSSKSERLEVKTATTSRRLHRFSSTQLPPPTGVSVQVASFLTQQVPSGMNVFGLYELVKPRAGLLARKRFDLLFSRFVAADEPKCEELMFDLEMAKSSLVIYEAKDIPQPILTAGVLSAKWEADLTGLTSCNSKNFLASMVKTHEG